MDCVIVLLQSLMTTAGRHSFATIANDNGWNMIDVKNVLGHKSLDLTLGTYTHTTRNGEEEIRKDINGLF